MIHRLAASHASHGSVRAKLRMAVAPFTAFHSMRSIFPGLQVPASKRHLCSQPGSHSAPAQVRAAEIQPVEDEEDVPPDLRTPTPGDPIARGLAGAVDLGVSLGVGLACGAAAGALSGVPQLAAWTAKATGVLAWVARDALVSEGHASLGKRMFGLELTYWDGALASRTDALLRNSPWLLAACTEVHPLVSRALVFIAVWDIATMIVTHDGRKAGDYMRGTYVSAVPAGVAQDARVLDHAEAMQMAQLEEEIEKLSPDAASVLESAKGFHSGDPSMAARLDEALATGQLERDGGGTLVLADKPWGMVDSEQLAEVALHGAQPEEQPAAEPEASGRQPSSAGEPDKTATEADLIKKHMQRVAGSASHT